MSGEKEIVFNCMKECAKNKTEDPLRHLARCCSENGVDPIKGIIIAVIDYDFLSVNSPFFKKECLIERW